MEWTEGHTVRVATAEGLILTKMVAFRPQDQIDIETLLTANRDDDRRRPDPRGMVPVRGDGGRADVLARSGHRPAGRPPRVSHGFLASLGGAASFARSTFHALTSSALPVASPKAMRRSRASVRQDLW